jgi:hypothetical protein
LGRTVAVDGYGEYENMETKVTNVIEARMDSLGRCLLLQPLQFLSDFILPCHKILEREWFSPGKMRSVLGMFSAGKPIQQ